MNAFNDLHKEARGVVARGSSVLSLEEDRLSTIRRAISPVIVRNSLIEGGVSKTCTVRPKHVHKIHIGTATEHL